MRVPPWLAKVRAQVPVSLHREIELFHELLRATPEEQRMRADLVARLRALVHELWPAARLTVYGSCATGTCLPMSDVDVVVEVRTPYPPLAVLGAALRERFPCSALDELPAARVPLIKLRDAPSQLAVDISFNSPTGPRNSDVVCALLERYPAARPLICVLKYLLYSHALNEVYTGGLGSYALALMVVAHIQRQSLGGADSIGATASSTSAAQGTTSTASTTSTTAPTPDLGALLLSFLRFYSVELDYARQGVALLREDGTGSTLFGKRDHGWLDPERPHLLALEDPSDPDNDVGRGTFRIAAVRQLFRDAYEQLTAPPFTPVSLLALLFDVPPWFQNFRRTVAAPFKTKTSPKKQQGPQQKGVQHRQQQQAQQRESTAGAAGDPPVRDTTPGSNRPEGEEEAAAQFT